MTTYAALDHTCWAGGYDLTGDSNKLVHAIELDDKDATVFGNRARQRRAGLEAVSSSVEGYWQAGSGTVDEAAIAGLTSLQVVTHTPAGALGDVAYFFQARTLRYEVFDAVGEVVPFSLQAQGARGNGTLSVGSVRGRLLAIKQSVNATGAVGAGYQMGAVAADEYLYGALHVFTAGTTITAVLESDDNSGFSSATTRATLGPLTTTGGTWATRVAGAITDTYWRYRVTAITGTFVVAGVAGIK